MVLAVVATTAARALPADSFRLLMARVGRAYLAGALAGWLVIGVSGLMLARARAGSIAVLSQSAWGRTLELKTGLAVAAVLVTLGHGWAGSRRRSKRAVLASRVLSSVLLVLTLAIFALAVRLTQV
jgi:hypothetical protein